MAGEWRGSGQPWHPSASFEGKDGYRRVRATIERHEKKYANRFCETCRGGKGGGGKGGCRKGKGRRTEKEKNLKKERPEESKKESVKESELNNNRSVCQAKRVLIYILIF